MIHKRFEVVKTTKKGEGEVQIILRGCEPVEPELATGDELAMSPQQQYQQFLQFMQGQIQGQEGPQNIIMVTIPYEEYQAEPLVVGDIVTVSIGEWIAPEAEASEEDVEAEPDGYVTGLYSDAEVAIIKKYYPDEKPSWIAQRINRDPNSVSQKIYVMKRKGELSGNAKYYGHSDDEDDTEEEPEPVENEELEQKIFDLFNIEHHSCDSKLRELVEERYGVTLHVKSLLGIISKFTRERNGHKCKECSKLEVVGPEGQWRCPVQGKDVRPSQFICLEQLEEIEEAA